MPRMYRWKPPKEYIGPGDPVYEQGERGYGRLGDPRIRPDGDLGGADGEWVFDKREKN